ncbi:hypothetical protein F4680DRAFT_434125 [Xylaria scruposa]|nr:hypothetical protein F4680DRAFT_434125 [Xylaria scruposa]
MHIAFHGSSSDGSGQVLQRESTDDGLSNDDGPQILIPILIAVLIISVSLCVLVFHFISQSRQRKKAKEEINRRFESAEHYGNASFMINEMENIQQTQELPQKKDGLSHELPGSTSMPQELPAAPHEMPAEACDKKSDTIRQNKISA